MCKYHYTYMLIDENDKRYIGARSSILPPLKDDYWSSSKYVKKAIDSGVKFKKEILATWICRSDAVLHEILLHDFFDVGRSENFYNKSKQTSTKFDTTGFVFSEESKRKISEASKRPKTNLKKQVCKLKGRKQSPSQIANRAKAQIGKIGMSNNRGAKPIFAINLLTKQAFIIIGKADMKANNFDPRTISRVCNKKPNFNTHKKHLFRFLNQIEINEFVLERQ